MQKTKFKQTEIGMIPEDWEVVKFRRILSRNIRHGIYKPKEFFNSKGTRIMKMGEVNDNDRISNQNMERVIATEEEIKKFGVHQGSLIFARTSMMTGGLGNCCIIMEKNDEIIFDGNLLCADLDSEIADSDFYLYYFKSKRGQSEIARMTTGTQSRNIPGSKLMEVNIPFLVKSEQERISYILSCLDLKRQINSETTITLKEIGQTLFKRWFVDFEFPNEKGEPYKSSGGEFVYNKILGKEIPLGWKLGSLGDDNLTQIIGSGITKFSVEKIYLATADVDGNDVLNFNTLITFSERPSRANMQPKPNTVWFAKMKNSKKILLFDDYHQFGLKNEILSTGFMGLEVEPYALYYIWNIILNDDFEKEKDNYCIGTTMEAINNDLVKLIKILHPERRVLEEFNMLVRVFYERANTNNIQNNNLMKIRDSLIPKLMSGKIRVPVEVRA